MNEDRLILECTPLQYDALGDESGKTGRAESVSFPKNAREVRQILEYVTSRKIPLTIQGGLTGITGGAVPAGGHAMNFRRMSRVTGMKYSRGNYILTVEPGLLLKDLRSQIEAKSFDTTGWRGESCQVLEDFKKEGAYFFPPDPTEPSASIGGMASCNASGARGFLYGPTRKYIQGARLLLTDGRTLSLIRGKERLRGFHFKVSSMEGENIEGELPELHHVKVKNASGYFIRENMDLIDLFIGAEGTLGIFTSLDLKLLPLPPAIWGITVFLPGEEKALDFLFRIKEEAFSPAAIEYFSPEALELLRAEKEQNPASSELPAIPGGSYSAVYLEYHGTEQRIESAVHAVIPHMEALGGDPDSVWAATNPREMERLTLFRHALPEAVNRKIAGIRKVYPGITKLGTDMAVEARDFRKTLKMYRRDLEAASLSFVIFGHMGDQHLHVNIIPADPREYNKGKELYRKWAAEIGSMGGTISAEHGVGKIKTPLLPLMYGEAGITKMRRVKSFFDRSSLLNRGNLFPE